MSSKYGYVEEQNPNAKEIGEYIIYYKHLLGEGKFGKVYKGIHMESKMKVAVKVSSNTYNLDQQGINKIAEDREIQIISKLKSDNLIAYYGYQITKNNIYIFTEYCNGGNLRQYMEKNRKLSDERIVEIVQQVCQGFKTLVAHNILHRDLKPDNIMLHDGIIKIGDFGFARVYDGDPNAPKDFTLKGTPLFVPPQLFDERKYSSKFDVWSLGIILYELMYDKVFHDGVLTMTQLQERLKQLKYNKIVYPKSNRSPLLLQLLEQMLQYSEEDRISWLSAVEYLGGKQPIGVVGTEYNININYMANNNSIVGIYQTKLQAANLFGKLIVDFDQNNYSDYALIKWKCIIIVLWSYYIKSYKNQITMVTIIPQLQDQQTEFKNSDATKTILQYLTDLEQEIKLQFDLFIVILNQWVNKPYAMTQGQGFPEDVILYGQIKRNDIPALLTYITKNVGLGVFPMLIKMGFTTLMRLIQQEQELNA